MALQTNTCGLTYTAISLDCVQDFEQVITSYLASSKNTMSLLDAVLSIDADMPMAVCLRGYLLRLAAHPQFSSAIDSIIERLDTLVSSAHCTLRERAHVEALKLVCADRSDAALSVLEDIILAHPQDILALRIAHYLHFYNGRGEDMRDSTGRVLQDWSVDHPQYSYLLGMHAFGLEESAQYDDALSYGKLAVANNPADIWATHAVTHVHQMRGAHEEGVQWLQELREFHHQDANNFRYHVIWHEALHWLGLDDPNQALQIYDAQLARSVVDDFYLDVCNNSALLWRLQFLGVDVGDRWQVLAECSATHVHDKELLFASLHYLIPLVVTGAEEASALLENIKVWATQSTYQGRLCASVGVGLAEAIAQAPRDPLASVNLLLEQQAESYRIGGSKAQRDLFRLLALDGANRAARPDLVAAIG